MVISNFRDYKPAKNVVRDRFYATVDVTTGCLWWKKTQARKVARDCGGAWFFVDTGAHCPIFAVTQLERAYTASNAAC